MNPTASIEDLRAQVDDINRDLLTLLSRRGEVVAQIGHAKTLEGRPQHYDPQREEKQFRELETLNPGPFTAAAVKAIFKEIFKASLDLEEANDKKGKPYYKFEILTRTGDRKSVVRERV